MGMGTRIRMVVWLVAALPGMVAAQVADALPCRDSEREGSLGISGIQCDRCQFITSPGADQAVFYTEPVILGLNPSAPSSRILREGDVLMAIDGNLITTSQGWDRFNNLPAQGSVNLRVRREGRVIEVNVPLMPVCTRRGDAPSTVIAGRPVLAPRPTRTGVTSLPPRPDLAAPASPVRAAPGVPAVTSPVRVPRGVLAPRAPTLAELSPRASLGFGFQCSYCSFDTETHAWTFTDAPEIQGVSRGGAAWEAGLRAGDLIVAIDGQDILTPEGGSRFAEIAPGDAVVWTIERSGQRQDIHAVAEERDAPRVWSTPARTERLIRFTGTVGGTTVEVSGARVSVTESEDGNLIVIQTGDNVIRIRATRAGGER